MPAIGLYLNYPVSEKLHAPWNTFKTAHGMAFSWPVVLGGHTTFHNVGNSIPGYLWREPNTGIIILKPAFLAAKRLELAIEFDIWIPASNINYGGTSQSGLLFAYTGTTAKNAATVGANYQASSPKLQSNTDVRLGLEVIDANLATFIARSDFSSQSFVWSMQTQVMFQANQAWSLLITPNSISADFTGSYVLVAFGGKLIMEITMAGVSYMWGDIDGNGNYILIDTYTLRDGGVNMNQAFQVSVIPLGRRFLSVSFTQHAAPGGRGRVAAYASQSESFLTVLMGQGAGSPNQNLEPYWDPSLVQWVKYGAAFLTLGLVSNDFDYNFVIAQGLFTDSGIVYMSEEHPPEDSSGWNGSNLVTPYVFAFTDQTEAAGGSGAYISPSILDRHGNSPPTPGLGIISALDMVPSQTGIYSPELHGYGISYPAKVETSSFTPIDISANWQLIRFKRTVDLNMSTVELKLLADLDYFTLLKLAGSCLLTAYNNSGVNTVLAYFYQERKDWVSEGPNQLITDQFTGNDMWDRLNNSPLLIETVLEGDTIASQIAQAIMDAGFTSAEVFIDYVASPELYAITFSLFTNPSDLLRPNSDSTCGDFIRNVASKLGAQFSPPLRVRWVPNGSGGMWWRINLGPIYQVKTDFAWGDVQHRFFLDDSLMSTVTYGTQQARYQASDFSVKGAPEGNVLRAPFNALLASSAKGIDGKQGSDVVFIPPPDRVLDDPTYIGYEGSMRTKQIGTEALQISQTTQTTQQIARQFYEQNYNLKRFRTAEFAGEWQPEIDVDDFVVIIGRAKVANGAMGYAAGDPVSYGAYRIDHIDIEIRADYDDPDGSGNNYVRYEWHGSYTLVYVGPYSDSGFTINGVNYPLVMWTTAANLPDDYDLPSNW